jgi:hypothetical protein
VLTFTGDANEVTTIGTPTVALDMGVDTPGDPAVATTQSGIKNGKVAKAAVPGTPGSNDI